MGAVEGVSVTRVTVEDLARMKALDVAFLRSCGVKDVDEGVLIEYRTPDGRRARSRLRTSLRGADGSHWQVSGTLPSCAYWRPPVDIDRSEVLVVEGESDCWTAWFHAINALGVPGADAASTILAEQLEGVEVAYIVRERPAHGSRTYPRGVDAFVRDVAERLRFVRPAARLLVLTMPEGHGDLNDMYRAAPHRFGSRVREAKDAMAQAWKS
jgi:hypothetical protein